MAVAIAIVAAACAAPTPRSGTPVLGTDLGRGPAPDFTLTDARTGELVSLSSLRGKVVVLTFLCSRCSAVSDLIAAYFRQAREELASDRDAVEFAAVSIDPQNDRADDAQRSSRAHGLEGAWRFLIGTEAELEAVWRAYGIRVAPHPDGSGVMHTDAIYLIDDRGRERMLLRATSGLDDLVRAARTLVAEGRLGS